MKQDEFEARKLLLSKDIHLINKNNNSNELFYDHFLSMSFNKDNSNPIKYMIHSKVGYGPFFLGDYSSGASLFVQDGIVKL